MPAVRIDAWGFRERLRRRRASAEDHGQRRRVAVPEDVELDAVAGRRLARDDIERVGRVERGAIYRGDDVAGLEAAVGGRAAGLDGLTGAVSGLGRDPCAGGDGETVGLLDGGV